MQFGIAWLLCACAAMCASVAGERWRWPDAATAESVRIDTKVRFIDSPREHDSERKHKQVQSDEVPFKEPSDTAGFYNRPRGEGRFPVRVEQDDPRAQYQQFPHQQGQNSQNNYNSDGTLDSLQYCKCTSNPDCNPRKDYANACGANEYLCCYNAPSKQHNSEYFNEVDEDRPSLLPGHSNIARPFPSPPGSNNRQFGPHNRRNNGPVLVGPQGPTGVIGPNQQVLIGPNDPNGQIGPVDKPDVLIGPEGPTGIIGPANQDRLVGPGGPIDELRPSETAQRGVLVGPGGPTGIIGPAGYRSQRQGVLVGPGGPSGIIGPQRGVLVGPGGPTGIIGPRGYQNGFRQGRNGILVGPGGPTGIIGPGRGVLVGPGGPTGQIGPRNYFFDN